MSNRIPHNCSDLNKKLSTGIWIVNKLEYSRRPLGLGQFFNKKIIQNSAASAFQAGRTLSWLGWFSDSPAPNKCFRHKTLSETRYFLRFFFHLSYVNGKTKIKIIQFLYRIPFSPQILLNGKYFESTSEELPNIIPNRSDKVRASQFEKFLLILKLSFKNCHYYRKGIAEPLKQ